MVSVKQICQILQYGGRVNLHQHKSKWKSTLQDIYVFIQETLYTLCALSHLFSAITRGVRYLPEFFQALCDNMIFWYLNCYCFYYHIRNRKLCHIIELTENTFTKADQQIVQKYHKRSNLFSIVLFIVVFSSSMFTIFLETVMPIPQNELEIRRYVYRTAHPERRHAGPVRIPFLDESKSWTYEIIYVLQMYILAIHSVWATCLSSIVPVMLMHIQGQYEILCKYISMIGKEHRDIVGNRIFYTSIERNEYVIESTPPVKRRNTQNRINRMPRRNKQIYEDDYLRQIVKFHQKLQHLLNEVSLQYLGTYLFCL
uniref:Odorant receptor n=1 Tax=Cacopsylla melanoneura TaxID=428564 RepID=A0A8D9ED10_9HEMI